MDYEEGKKLMLEVLGDVDSYIFEASRAGLAGCSYTYDDTIPTEITNWVTYQIINEYQYKVTRDYNTIKIDWSNK